MVRNVGVNPTRDGVIEVLRRMGAKIEFLNQRIETGEPVADIKVYGSQLAGSTSDRRWRREPSMSIRS